MKWLQTPLPCICVNIEIHMAINRRDCLKLGGGLLAVAAFGSVTRGEDRPAVTKPEPALSDAPKRSIHKAIMYATIGWRGTVLEKFKAIKAAGFEGVEPMSGMDQKEVLDALHATELKAASCCCSTHWGKPLSHQSEAVRKEAIAGVTQALKDAKHYGASSILLVPGVVNTEVTYEDCWKRSIAGIRELIPLAKELDVKIAIENVWNNFITKPEQAKEYLDEIDSPVVGWHFDIGNVLKYSPPETWIPVIGKRILKLHIKEYSKAKGFGVKLFDGDNNWPAICKALDDIGYSGWGIAEQPGAQSKDFDTIADLSKRMDKAFAS